MERGLRPRRGQIAYRRFANIPAEDDRSPLNPFRRTEPRHEKRFGVRPHPGVAKIGSASDRPDLRRLSPGGVGVPLATGVLIFALQSSARAGELAAKIPGSERDNHPPPPTTRYGDPPPPPPQTP